ncbi:hypothetical protein BLS_001914 [Venturia inaequalis]|uniref:DUF7918 domain-containing protein n=1 Tax=Venturia inaequalis TaxID=5025 RepID=A0A8H3U0C9_VENIN|nr:hypothetical protein BLS_001914 [Venturia inaequalis]
MAILSGFPGLEVVVTVNGNSLHEYDLPDDSDEITTNASTIKYIEAHPGTKFAVRTTAKGEFKHIKNDLYWKVMVDGKEALLRDKISRHSSHPSIYDATIGGVKVASGNSVMERPFTFSALETDNDTINGSDSAIQAQVGGLGQISVKLYRVKYLPTTKSKAKKYMQDRDATKQSLTEKALKGRALSRQTTLGAPLPSKAKKDDLHAEMIVSKPLPLEERDLDTLTLEEMHELLKRQANDLERQKLKRLIEENRRKLSGTTEGGKEENKDTKEKIKREHESAFGRSSSASASKRRQIKTIDLSAPKRRQIQATDLGAAKRRQIETIDLSEHGVKTAIKTEMNMGRGSMYGGNSNIGANKRHQYEIVDLTDG